MSELMFTFSSHFKRVKNFAVIAYKKLPIDSSFTLFLIYLILHFEIRFLFLHGNCLISRSL